ncbi:DNA polymerase III subunit psi [Thalassotalea euphylliae]|uniref:DNA polymerase III subunit psi n=1 Tax=Thalassotalea euphylliae TaxID=1655234 RepID=A0A3E0UJA2_9GAMM|nr:DNA polymerase III subunit psi [Thalassotalea euphylliae]REL36644.1 hypothetical protein DXX92_15725 [Thalassotalea euphylliae]
MIQQAAFDKLTAMGIDLYQLRDQQNSAPSADYLAIDVKATANHRLYLDILTALSLNQTEVGIKEDKIDLGLLQWQFHQAETIELTKQHLVTPSLDVLAQQPQLKQQLWLLLAN